MTSAEKNEAGTLNQTNSNEPNSNQWDVIIVGAGPAGCAAAIAVARKGRAVLLVDAKKFPRRKACGGCLNPNSIGLLQELIGADDPLWNESIQLKHYQIFQRARSFEYPIEAGYAVDRAAMDLTLVKHAQQRGVDFRDQTSAKLGDARDGRRIVLTTSGGQTIQQSAKCVVIASGLGSRTAANYESLHQTPSADSRLGVEAIFSQWPEQYRTGTLAMAIGKGGYVGLTEIGENRLHVAAALDRQYLQTHGPQTAVEKILEQSGAPALPRTDVQWKGTPALTASTQRLAEERVFLVGDAATYVEPFTGEGIRWALESGKGVMPLVETSIDQWNGGLIDRWEQWYNDNIVAQQRLCKTLSRGLKRPVFRWFAHQGLRFTPSVAAKVIQQINS